jgi:hypothetical protein
MPPRTQFSRRRAVQAPSARRNPEILRLDFRGIDLTTPYDVMEENRTPFARNFRMYAEEVDSRRVAVSNRKGSEHYIVPFNEALEVANDSLTGAADALVGVNTEWKATPIAVGTTGRLTMVDVRLKNDLEALGVVLVEIYDDNSGVPGSLIASSSILPSDVTSSPAWVSARFIEAPLLDAAETYWLVLRLQDDASGTYVWRYTTDTSVSLTSNNGGLSWDSTAYTLNWKLYTADDTTVKGAARYAPSTSSNRTLLAIGQNVYRATDGTGALTSVIGSLDASATEYWFTFADDKAFFVNGYDDLQYIDSSNNVTVITHAQLPILRLATFHKNVLWGVSAEDPNKLVYSVAPAEDDGSGNEWYEGWLSTNFGYVPAPKANDPITAILPFQDSLVVFTRTQKWVIYGSNAADVNPRQAQGKKGAVSQKGVFADENYVYFVADDGFYRWNGAEDEKISDRVQTEFDRISNKEDVFVTKWKGHVRFYYSISGESYNSRCLLWHTSFEEWMLDTDAFVSYAVPFTDGDDNNELAEVSSLVSGAAYAEVNDHNMGKQIDFLYYCRAEAMGNPAKRKRIVRFIPLLEGESGDYHVEIAMDKNRRDDASYQNFALTTEGAELGTFELGDGTVLGSTIEFAPKRIRFPGYAYYWQPRIKRKAVNNPVNFIGYVLSYREKRL